MKRAVGVGLLLAACFAAGAASADAPTRSVSMPGKLYDPEKLNVLVGTTVTWRNDDSVNHTVTSDADELLASGYIPPGGSFTFTFTKEGRHAFHCSVHRFMRGEVSVFGLVLAGPESSVPAGARVVFAGLAPPGTTQVTLRGPVSIPSVRPRDDGSFAIRIAIASPGSFRAVAGSLSSPPVRVIVRPRVVVRRSGNLVAVHATPARPGAKALLQAYDRERFDWVTVRRGMLDRRSRARFRVPPGDDRLRVLVRGAAGWGDAVSSTIRLGGGAGATDGRADGHAGSQGS